jgi:hypothetical protein
MDGEDRQTVVISVALSRIIRETLQIEAKKRHVKMSQLARIFIIDSLGTIENKTIIK